MKTKVLASRRDNRKKAITAKIKASMGIRLGVFRSSIHIYAYITDDTKGRIVFSSSDQTLVSKTKMTKTQKAFEVGKNIAQKAKEAGITKIAFDRSGFLYHGRVKSLADGAREGGLDF